MKKLVIVVVMSLLAGCAGLNVTWQLQADYISKELAAQRKAESAEQVAPK